MIERVIPTALRPHWSAYKEASDIWRRRVRETHYERAVTLFLTVVASELFCVWLTHWTIGTITDPLARMLYSLTTGILMAIGALTVALAALAIYTFTILAIQYLLPGIAAFAITIGGFAASHWFDVKNRVILGAAWLYPPEFHDAYREIATPVAPFIVGLMAVSTTLLVALSVYVQSVLLRGLLQDGPSFRTSATYNKWSENDAGLPKTRDMMLKVLRSWLPAAPESPVALDEPSELTNDTAAPSMRFDASYRAQRRKHRHRERASRRANRRR